MRLLIFSIAAALILGTTAYAALGVRVLQTSSLETNASCAIGNSGTRIPRSVCRWYLSYQLSNGADSNDAQRVLHLSIGAYPTDAEHAHEIIELALSKGAPINQSSPVSGYPPLHEAILLNEPSLARFLIENGANLETEAHKTGLTAIAFLSALKERNPDQNLSEIEMLLQRQ